MMKNEKGSKIGNGKWIGSENNDGNEQRAKMRIGSENGNRKWKG